MPIEGELSVPLQGVSVGQEEGQNYDPLYIRYIGYSHLTQTLITEYSRSFLYATLLPLFSTPFTSSKLDPATTTTTPTTSTPTTTNNNSNNNNINILCTVHALLQRILSELSSHTLDGPLLYVTCAFLCSNILVGDLPSPDYTNTTAANPPLFNSPSSQLSTSSTLASTTGTVDIPNMLITQCECTHDNICISSMYTISMLLLVAPLPLAVSLVDKGLTGITQNYDPSHTSLDLLINWLQAHTTTNTNTTNTDNSPHNSDPFTTLLKYTLHTLSYTATPTEQETNKIHKVNALLVKICEYIHTSKIHDVQYDINNKNTTITSSSNNNNADTDTAYIHKAQGYLLGRLTGHNSDPSTNNTTTNNTHTNTYSDSTNNNTNNNTINNSNSVLLHVILNKLGIILTLSHEQQIALSLLVYRYICILGTTVIQYNNNTNTNTTVYDNNNRIYSILLILYTLEDTWYKLHSSLLEADPETAGTGIVHSTPTSKVQGDSSPSLLTRQNTAVVIREMLCEVRGVVSAVQQLRHTIGGGSDPSPSTFQHDNFNLTGIVSLPADIWESLYDQEEDIAACDILYNTYGVELGPLKGQNSDLLEGGVEGGLEGRFLEEYNVVYGDLTQL